LTTTTFTDPDLEVQAKAFCTSLLDALGDVACDSLTSMKTFFEMMCLQDIAANGTLSAGVAAGQGFGDYCTLLTNPPNNPADSICTLTGSEFGTVLLDVQNDPRCTGVVVTGSSTSGSVSSGGVAGICIAVLFVLLCVLIYCLYFLWFTGFNVAVTFGSGLGGGEILLDENGCAFDPNAPIGGEEEAKVFNLGTLGDLNYAEFNDLGNMNEMEPSLLEPVSQASGFDAETGFRGAGSAPGAGGAGAGAGGGGGAGLNPIVPTSAVPPAAALAAAGGIFLLAAKPSYTVVFTTKDELNAGHSARVVIRIYGSNKRDSGEKVLAANAEDVETWSAYYDELVKFNASTGTPNVPHDYPTNESLALWVLMQKHLRATGKLESEKVQALSAFPGWEWDMSPAARQRAETLVPEQNSLVPGKTQRFFVACTPLGDLTKMMVRLEGKNKDGSTPQWHIEKARVHNQTTMRDWDFQCGNDDQGRWVGSKVGDGQSEVMLYLKSNEQAAAAAGPVPVGIGMSDATRGRLGSIRLLPDPARELNTYELTVNTESGVPLRGCKCILHGTSGDSGVQTLRDGVPTATGSGLVYTIKCMPLGRVERVSLWQGADYQDTSVGTLNVRDRARLMNIPFTIGRPLGEDRVDVYRDDDTSERALHARRVNRLRAPSSLDADADAYRGGSTLQAQFESTQYQSLGSTRAPRMASQPRPGSSFASSHYESFGGGGGASASSDAYQTLDEMNSSVNNPGYDARPGSAIVENSAYEGRAAGANVDNDLYESLDDGFAATQENSAYESRGASKPHTEDEDL
jgi:hypothetical protein